MSYLDTERFDRLNEEEVLDRIGALLAVAIGRREQQQQLAALVGAPQAAPGGVPTSRLSISPSLSPTGWKRRSSCTCA